MGRHYFLEKNPSFRTFPLFITAKPLTEDVEN